MQRQVVTLAQRVSALTSAGRCRQRRRCTGGRGSSSRGCALREGSPPPSMQQGPFCNKGGVCVHGQRGQRALPERRQQRARRR